MKRHGAMRRRLLPAEVLLMAILMIPAGCVHTSESSDQLPGTSATAPDTSASVTHYAYEVVNAYPHDDRAFTEGLAYENGILYEGTGLRGRSSLREVELQTGVVLDSVQLDRDLFGEGITIVGDRILQLTWQSGLGFVYDKSDLQLVSQFAYDTEGWGLAYDGQRLIMSDGTDTLYFLNPETFAVEGSVAVSEGGTPVTELNELEFIDGLVYANVWKTNSIAIIDPGTGRVTGWLDLTGLLATRSTARGADVLNGIAYDAAGNRLFVTGKLWPWLFEIKLVQS
jgi:glutamine cyclotransferase